MMNFQFQDIVEDFFNLELELEIDEKLVNHYRKSRRNFLEVVDDLKLSMKVYFLFKLDIFAGKIYFYESQNKIVKLFFRVCKIFESSRFVI